MLDQDVIIQGIAHRGDCDPEIATFVAGARLAVPTLDLYPQLNQHVVIGEAELNVADNGDIHVVATIFARHVSWLMGFPFLSVTINDPEGGPREIIQAAVTDHVNDPLQLPYRIIQFPDEIREGLSYSYDPVIEIDEAHLTAVQLNGDGSYNPLFDQTKTHVELRHRTEKLRREIPNAIARAFGYESWTRDVELCDYHPDEPVTTLRVLREVMDVLNIRPPRRESYPVIGLPVVQEDGTTGVSP